MFLRARPEEAAEIAIKRLQLRNISRSMTLGSRGQLLRSSEVCAGATPLSYVVMIGWRCYTWPISQLSEHSPANNKEVNDGSHADST